MANMLSATKELVSVLKADTSNTQEVLRMRTHEKWMKMASIYATCGQHDLALATMKKIEDDEDQLAASKAVRYHNPPKEVEERRTTHSASDQHGKENAWDSEGNKWCDAGEAAVDPVQAQQTVCALSASRLSACISAVSANDLFATPVVTRRLA